MKLKNNKTQIKLTCCISFFLLHLLISSQNQLVLESAAKSRLLVEAASEKGVDRDEAGYEGDSSVQPSPLPHLG